MQKTLKMINNTTTYDVMEGEEKLFSIEKSKNEISGTELYDKIFCNLSKNEQIEIAIIDENFINKDDQIIRDRFKDLIEKICTKINGPVDS